MISERPSSTRAASQSGEVIRDQHVVGLLPHHLKALQSRGLNLATIIAAGIRSETNPINLAVLLGMRRPPKRLAPAIVVPFDEGYAHVRPDTPRIRDKKPVKWECPAGQSNRIYVPTATRDVLRDATVDLCLTEGALKALAIKQAGFHAIGLAGCLGWKDKGHERLLAEMEHIAWEGRLVQIVFDSDVISKAAVLLSETTLAKHLTDRGAIVRCVRLPDGPPDESGEPTKLGADDYLATHTVGEFRKLLDTAQEPDTPSPEETKERAERIEPATMGREYLEARQSDGLYHIRHWRGTFWLWGGGRYIELDPAEVKAQLILAINRGYVFLSNGIVANILSQVQAQGHLPSRIDPPSWIGTQAPPWPADEVLATQGNLIHMPSLVAGKPYSMAMTPRLFNHSVLPYRFDPEAPAPTRWLALMDEIWGGQPDVVSTWQEWMGHSLTADTRQQKILLMIGPPRSGKGTLMRVLEQLVGPENVCGPTLASMAGEFGLAPFLGKLLAVINDARLGGRTDSAVVVERLLSISGEDSLSANRKFREPINGKIPARLVIVSNELPKLAEGSGALASRMLVLRMRRSFLGNEDPNLTSTLKAELPGILLWAIAGWQRLRERGHFIQPASGRELANEMKDLSSPTAAFVRDCCLVGPECEAVVDDVYSAWCDWCKDNRRDRVTYKATFCRDLRAAVPDLEIIQPRTEGGRTRRYQGLGLAR